MVANSDAEAQWLLTHGYPTEYELARLETLHLDQLKAQSQSGNKAAPVIYRASSTLNRNTNGCEAVQATWPEPLHRQVALPMSSSRLDLSER
ncbi:hypothetical protein ACFQS6_05755 [Xanthomonas populi]